MQVIKLIQINSLGKLNVPDDLVLQMAKHNFKQLLITPEHGQYSNQLP